MTIARAAIGTKLKRGDGGVGAATKASKTIGTSNQLLKIEALVAGTGGNSKTFGIVVSGNNTAFSIVVTANSVLINSATDGSAVATTTVDHAIAALAQNETFLANFRASTTGNGTGVLVAGASGVLSGGAAGAEAFTEVPGLLEIGGPDRSRDTIDVTAHDSEDYYREFLKGLKDGGQVTGVLNLRFSNAVHLAMNDDFEDDTDTPVNYQIEARDGTVYEFATLATQFAITSAINEQYKANFTLKITGKVDITPGS